MLVIAMAMPAFFALLSKTISSSDSVNLFRHKPDVSAIWQFLFETNSLKQKKSEQPHLTFINSGLSFRNFFYHHIGWN